MAGVERIEYDEFGLFHENAQEYGIPFESQPVVERRYVDVGGDRRISALVWGEAAPELVLVHGGAQNAHTWDTVALATGRALVAVDLPGHGHSDGGRGGSSVLEDNALDLATVIEELAPDARAVVGMSLGGLSSIALAGLRPDLVRRLVLVDVTPGVTPAKSTAITNFVNGPASFANFDDILKRTVEHNPGRSVSSLRRGILHNAVQQEDGSWVWRYARFRTGDPRTFDDLANLWDVIAKIEVPVMLVRGMRAQSVVDDEDEAELLRRLATARVEHVEDAGHSVQGDAPLELARLLSDFVP
ncbi:MAG TPA: alpha/beta hydrolase [Acidimicrobiales bacterium]|nr:alpha/beta hydrolase [Acidimicrobiales bacterium]